VIQVKSGRQILEELLLFALILVAALRPLIAESYDSGGSSISEALGELRDPTPVTTIVFDCVILAAFSTWLTMQCFRPSATYRRTGLEIGTLLVGLGAVVSCCFSGNKRLAINASLDWLCFPIFAMALVQVIYRPWHRRLLFAAIMASAAAQAVQCFDQYFVGFDQTWEHYQSIKQEFWARQGVALDSAKVELFESRMRAREATGFLSHSNITGSYMVLCGLAAVGAVVGRWRVSKTSADRFVAVACGFIAFLILGATILTGSRGALVAGMAGAGLWILVTLLRRWIEKHRARASFLAWLLIGGGLFSAVGHGLYHGSLPGVSLSFRWQYWVSSTGLIGDHFLTGVGRENFGRHYLQYKSLASPEEISNPHNLFVQIASEWGLLGLVGIIIMLVGGSITITRVWPPPNPSLAREDVDSKSISGVDARFLLDLTWAISLALAVVLCRLPLLGTSNPYFLYASSIPIGLAWLVSFLCFVQPQWGGDSGGELPTTGTATGCGLFAFLLHEMINFALFVPGSAVTFFALLAYCISGLPTAKANHPRGKRPWLGSVMFIAVTTTAAVGVLVPVWRAAFHLSKARAAVAESPSVALDNHLAQRHFLAAAAADPLDPTPHVLRAEWLLGMAVHPPLRAEALTSVIGSLDQAGRRDPAYLHVHRLRARVYLLRAGHTASAEDYAAAVSAAEKVVELYPLDPQGIVALADCQKIAAEATHSSGLFHSAADNYRRALRLDDSRPNWERIRRFRERERKEIESKMAEAEQLANQS